MYHGYFLRLCWGLKPRRLFFLPRTCSARSPVVPSRKREEGDLIDVLISIEIDDKLALIVELNPTKGRSGGGEEGKRRANITFSEDTRPDTLLKPYRFRHLVVYVLIGINTMQVGATEKFVTVEACGC